MRRHPGMPGPPGQGPLPPGIRRPVRGSSPAGPAQPPAQYGAFQASLLFCPTCREATPTRERLLLVLPSGNLFEYLCAYCGTSTGSKTDRDQSDSPILAP